MAAITKAQIKSIHVAKARLGLEDDTYRQKLCLMFNVGSCKQLTRSQASTLLKSLGRPLKVISGKPQGSKKKREKPATVASVGNIVALASAKQLKLIDNLINEVDWRKREDGYYAWLTKNLGIDRIRTVGDAAKVIEGLKGLKKHAKK